MQVKSDLQVTFIKNYLEDKRLMSRHVGMKSSIEQMFLGAARRIYEKYEAGWLSVGKVKERKIKNLKF